MIWEKNKLVIHIIKLWAGKKTQKLKSWKLNINKKELN